MRSGTSSFGLRFVAVRPSAEGAPLRSDIAGFIGCTQRGPVGQLVRVEGWREYTHRFGGLDSDAVMTYAIRGYFENGGQIAHIYRVTHRESHCSDVACGYWKVANEILDEPDWSIPYKNTRASNGSSPDLNRVRLFAASVGKWAMGLAVSVSLERLQDDSLKFNFQTRTRAGECHRFHVVLDQATITSSYDGGWSELAQLVAERSDFIRIDRPVGGGFTWRYLPKRINDFTWREVRLDQWNPSLLLDKQPRVAKSVMEQYELGLSDLMEEPEVAIVAFPEYEQGVDDPQEFLVASCRLAAQKQDRIVIADLPDRFDYSKFMNATTSSQRRCVSVFEPRLIVNDATGSRTLTVSASGHMAGVMSKIDRERGAHHSPANLALLDAIDLAGGSCHGNPKGEAPTYANQIRSRPGRGIQVWGSRTLDEQWDGRFIAHRRFIHRLIRAVRRVAEPIVFEVNSPELWRMLTRAVTTILLEAFRGGAFIGERPDEAFYVKCDESTNPYAERELGRVVCEIGLALAAPMEFITIRIKLSQDGNLEVFES